MAKLNDKGQEVLDPTPVAIPVRALRRPSTLDEIRQYIGLVNREAEQAGQETFEESDDFDVGDDYDPQSPWEQSVDQEENWAAFRAEVALAKEQAARGQAAGAPLPPSGNHAQVPASGAPNEPVGNTNTVSRDGIEKKGAAG